MSVVSGLSWGLCSVDHSERDYGVPPWRDLGSWPAGEGTGIADPVSKLQVDTLDANCDSYGITQFKMNDKRQGIVHVIGPEQGATLPGMTVVCGDSHTSTHGAFGVLVPRVIIIARDPDDHQTLLWGACLEYALGAGGADTILILRKRCGRKVR